MSVPAQPYEILLAEDNSADIALVRRALKVHDVNCVLHVIQDGEQAIEWIERVDTDPKVPPLDLMLLDMHLPKRNGEDILRCLRTSVRNAQTPVIAMTSIVPKIAREAARGQELLVCFNKPSTLDEFMQLGSIVGRVLAGRPNGTGNDRKDTGGAA